MKYPKEIIQQARRLPEFTYEVKLMDGSTQVHPMNHVRRVKQIYKTHGYAGVNSYILAVFKRISDAIEARKSGVSKG